MRAALNVMLTVLVAGAAAAGGISEVAGWEGAGGLEPVGPDRLYEQINGGADAFLAYGFQVLHWGELSRGELVVSVGIYDMGTALDAFGIYRTENPAADGALDIGAEALLSPPYQCVLLKDRFYVKVDAYEGDITETVGRSLLEALAAALPGSDGMPAELGRLPESGLVAGSLTYAREGYLGLGELRRCLSGRYASKGGGEHQVFVVVPEEGATGRSLWDGLASRWTLRSEGGFEALVREIPYRGFVGVTLVGDSLVGVSDVADEASLLERLRVLAGA